MKTLNKIAAEQGVPVCLLEKALEHVRKIGLARQVCDEKKYGYYFKKEQDGQLALTGCLEHELLQDIGQAELLGDMAYGDGLDPYDACSAFNQLRDEGEIIEDNRAGHVGPVFRSNHGHILVNKHSFFLIACRTRGITK
jgi:hypothetical protein